MTRRRFLMTASLVWWRPPALAQTTAGQTVELRGRVVRLASPPPGLLPGSADFDHGGVAYALEAADGTRHAFLPTDTAAAVYQDWRVQARELQVTARLFPATSFIEVIKLQSLRAGRLYDLYYFCDVCNVTTHKPGPCQCCQEPVELREAPAAPGPN
jgi:hypothetical protein